MSLARQEFEILEEYRFGDFSLNVAQRRLQLRGEVLHLSGKPFDVLVYLVKHRERIISGEEIFNRVWKADPSGNRVYDPQYIQQAISTIRKVLGDDPRSPEHISTDRGHGFRFIAAIKACDSPISSHETPSVIAGPEARRRRWVWISIAVLAPLGALLMIALAPTRVELPHVVNSVALTHTGFKKYAPIVVRGDDLYFTEFANGHYRITRLHQPSGETSVFATTVPEPYLCASSPDGKSFLIKSVVGSFDDYGPLFVQPVEGGPPHPLPIIAFDGSWSPSGNEIVFARGPEISLFDEATQQHKLLARVEGYAWWPRWSPDGGRLRFTVSDGKTQQTTLWEVRSDGSNLRRVFADKAPWGKASGGTWTPNGRYFVFQANSLSSPSLWLLDEDRRVSAAGHNPIQLTFASAFRGPQLSWDGQKIYAKTLLYRGELTKFEPITGKQSTFLPNVMADMASFGRNGRWLVYCQDKTLWLGGIDGSSPHRLIPPPTESAFPQWSPDGRQVVVATRKPDQPWRLSLLWPDSGTIEELKLIEGNALHPTWSPDGNRIAFGSIPSLDENSYLYIADLSNRRVSTIPGSQGLFTPAWSPDGRFIAALRGDSSSLMLYDLTTNSWSRLGDAKFGYPVWSFDAKFIYCYQYEKQGVHVVRINVKTRKSEQLVDLTDFPLIDRWLGLHPDGSILVPKNISLQEIYALELHPSIGVAASGSQN